MSVSGLKKIEAAIAAHKRKTARGMRAGLIMAGLFLQREAQLIVPVDTTDLKESANTRPEGKGMDTQVVVSFGTEYAVYVHENLEARHAPGKQAKFLETPLREKGDRMAEIVVETMRTVL